MTSFAAILLGTGLAFAGQAPTAGRCADGRVWSAPVSEQVQMLAELQRARGGRTRLVRSPLLDRMAMAHSIDMACRNFFDHRNPDRLKMQDRLRRAAEGPVPDWRRLAEVIGTSLTARRQIDRWLGSRSHRRAVLDKEHERVGIGFVRIAGSRYPAYWTVEFLANDR